jgi:N6-adenosine-specific RNA methylase IME4
MVVFAMKRDGLTLHLEQQKNGGARWFPSDGNSVPASVAAEVATSSSIADVGDSLFAGPVRLSKGVRELIVAPKREHSRKPDETYRRIEALCEGPYVELFARQQWPGWIAIGDEVGKFQPELGA